SVSFFESLSPLMGRRGSRITAAVTTGPHSGPRPTSSTPATSSSTRLKSSPICISLPRPAQAPPAQPGSTHHGARYGEWRQNLPSAPHHRSARVIIVVPWPLALPHLAIARAPAGAVQADWAAQRRGF